MKSKLVFFTVLHSDIITFDFTVDNLTVSKNEIITFDFTISKNRIFVK